MVRLCSRSYVMCMPYSYTWNGQIVQHMTYATCDLRGMNQCVRKLDCATCHLRTHLFIPHSSFLIHKHDVTLSYVRRDSFVYVTWLFRIFPWLLQICDESRWDAMSLVDMYAMPHSYMWHASFIHVTWLIHTCDMTHSYMWHASLIYVIWLIDMTKCHKTHSYVTYEWGLVDMSHWYVSLICHIWVTYECHKTHSYVTYEWGLIDMTEWGLSDRDP